MAIDYAELKTELETDPKGLGYAGTSDPEAAALLNEIGGSSEKINRDHIDGQEMMAVVVISEYASLSVMQRTAWMAIISAGTGMVDVNNAGTVAQVLAVWADGTTTRENLIALRKRDASRAEVLFGQGQAVGFLDVGRARTGDY